MNARRPLCRHCRRPLRVAKFSTNRVAYGVGYTRGAQSREEAVAALPEGAVISRERKPGHADGVGVLWWHEKALKFGDYGDGFFCGLRCGYRWAVARMRAPDPLGEALNSGNGTYRP